MGYKIKYSFIVILFTILIGQISSAQNRLELNFVKVDDAEYVLPKIQQFDNEVQLIEYLNTIVDEYVQDGFLAAGVDSLEKDSLYYTAYFYRGEKIVFSEIKKGNIDKEALKKVDFERFKNGKKKNIEDFLHLRYQILEYYENNGYPFASVGFDSVVFTNNGISAVLHVEKQALFVIDSVVNRGDANISSLYLQQYLNIKESGVYNEAEIQKITQRCEEIPFVKVKKPFGLSFYEDKTKVYLYLDQNMASSFDGVLGVQPSNDIPVKIILTGDVRLNLINSLGKGEHIKLNWRKMDKQTQDISLKFTYPYLFNLPFGVDYDFNLYKKDTSYITVHNDIGIQYYFSLYHFVKIFLQNDNGFIVDTKSLEGATVLPSYADISINMPGIAYANTHYDYLYNPKKGYRLLFDVGLGVKKIKENANLNPLLYEGLKLKSYQMASSLTADVFLHIKGRSTLMLRNRSGIKKSEELFENELYRIGGLNTLRGFDEESIYASFYSIFTAEYRFILEKRSYISAFFDYCYYENYSINNRTTDRPIGFGVGFSLDTKAGIFTINYALGRQFDNPIAFKSAKIHFGITARF